MRRTICLIGAALIAAAPPALAKAPAPAGFASLGQSIDAAVASKVLPSVVAVVFDEHGILWSHVAGYSDVATKTAPTLSTRYRVGSLAKSVTSTVLAIAEQKRLLSMDALVTVRTAQGSTRLTLRSLVNMQAGLAQAVCYDGVTGGADPECTGSFDSDFAVQ